MLNSVEEMNTWQAALDTLQFNAEHDFAVARNTFLQRQELYIAICEFKRSLPENIDRIEALVAACRKPQSPKQRDHLWLYVQHPHMNFFTTEEEIDTDEELFSSGIALRNEFNLGLDEDGNPRPFNEGASPAWSGIATMREVVYDCIAGTFLMYELTARNSKKGNYTPRKFTVQRFCNATKFGHSCELELMFANKYPVTKSIVRKLCRRFGYSMAQFRDLADDPVPAKYSMSPEATKRATAWLTASTMLAGNAMP